MQNLELLIDAELLITYHSLDLSSSSFVFLFFWNNSTFNFSVPFLSRFAIVALLAVTIILFFVPLRYLIMAWGLNKFTKKLRSPNAIPNNELLDFLSRVPDTDEKVNLLWCSSYVIIDCAHISVNLQIMYRELKAIPSTTAIDTLSKAKKKTT